MTATELYDGVIMEGTSDLRFVADSLQRHGAGWCLIGGMAINSYVAPVFTADCNLVVVSADLEPVLADLREADCRVKGFPFSINAQLRLAEEYPETVEPLLPNDLRKRSQANRALRAASLAEEGLGDED